MPYCPDQILVTTLKNTKKWHSLTLLCNNWNCESVCAGSCHCTIQQFCYESPMFSLYVLDHVTTQFSSSVMSHQCSVCECCKSFKDGQYTVWRNECDWSEHRLRSQCCKICHRYQTTVTEVKKIVELNICSKYRHIAPVIH
jgi:hypothetical protein